MDIKSILGIKDGTQNKLIDISFNYRYSIFSQVFIPSIFIVNLLYFFDVDILNVEKLHLLLPKSFNNIIYYILTIIFKFLSLIYFNIIMVFVLLFIMLSISACSKLYHNKYVQLFPKLNLRNGMVISYSPRKAINRVKYLLLLISTDIWILYNFLSLFFKNNLVSPTSVSLTIVFHVFHTISALKIFYLLIRKLSSFKYREIYNDLTVKNIDSNSRYQLINKTLNNKYYFIKDNYIKDGIYIFCEIKSEFRYDKNGKKLEKSAIENIYFSENFDEVKYIFDNYNNILK